MNGEHVLTEDHMGDFGEYFGYFVGEGNKITVDWIGIWIMDLSKGKSARIKDINRKNQYFGKGEAVMVPNVMKIK